MPDHHADERVHRLSSRLTRRRTRRWALGSLVAAVAAGTAQAEAEGRKEKGENISIVEMFELQMQMNHTSQQSEMSANVVDAAILGATAPVRGIK